MISSTVRQQAFYRSRIGFVDGRGSAQVAHPLGAFFRQNVPTVRLVSLKGSCTRASEPFGRAPVGFYFWHYKLLLRI
jgi:hypothetical protein